MDAMVEPQTILAARYRVGDVLGRGRKGIVYRGEDERLDRPVAIKAVPSADPDQARRLRLEAAHLARLNHPNIVRLYDVVDHDGWPYLVTQFVEGRPLRDLVGRLTAERTAWIGEEIASALAVAHQLGIVHRDLNPSNVLVDDDALHLLGFGTAHQGDDDPVANSDPLVVTGPYVAPEQRQGRTAEPAADIYALGLLLVECLTGRTPRAHTIAEPTARLDLAGVPASWRALLHRMTAIEPTSRPGVAEVGRELRRLRRAAVADIATRHPEGADARSAGGTLAGTAPSTARPVRAHNRRTVRSRAVVPVAVAAGFLGVVGAATAVSGGAPEPVGSTEIAAAAPATPAPTIPSTTLPPTTTPPPTAPPTAPPTTARPAPPPPTVPPTAPPTTAPAPVPVTATTLDARTRRELQQLKQAQDFEAFQKDIEKRLEDYTKRVSKRGRRNG